MTRKMTQEEKIAFRKSWDAKFQRAKARIELAEKERE